MNSSPVHFHFFGILGVAVKKRHQNSKYTYTYLEGAAGFAIAGALDAGSMPSLSKDLNQIDHRTSITREKLYRMGAAKLLNMIEDCQFADGTM